MKQFDHVILRMRKNPFKTSFIPDFKIDWGPNKSGKVEYPSRQKEQVKIFDIRDFVKENFIRTSNNPTTHRFPKINI